MSNGTTGETTQVTLFHNTTGKWYSFKAVYDFGVNDTDMPMLKAYVNVRYLGEIKAANSSSEYYNVDSDDYIKVMFIDGISISLLAKAIGSEK